MSADLDKCYEVIVKSVKHVGQIIKTNIWSTKAKIDVKSSEIDLVTETDQEVEKYLISTLKENFPDHLFIGEESVADGAKCELTDGPTWIIDPVDGTMNFVHGYPNVCVSVGLVIKKEPVLAIIYNPVLELFFEARKNQGAKLNGNVIRASETKEMSKALLGFEFGTSREPARVENCLKNVQLLIPKLHGIRASGSAALNMAFVALGSTDAYFEYGIHAWDVAAGQLIVTEAGGVVIDPAGGQFDVLSRRVLCAGTKELAEEMSKVIVQLYPERD